MSLDMRLPYSVASCSQKGKTGSWRRQNVTFPKAQSWKVKGKDPGFDVVMVGVELVRGLGGK